MLLRRAAMLSAAFIATAAVAQNPQAQQQQGATQAARPAAPPTATDKNKLSYAIGFELGSDFREKSADIDVNTVIKAIQDASAGRYHSRVRQGGSVDARIREHRAQSSGRERRVGVTGSPDQHVAVAVVPRA